MKKNISMIIMIMALCVVVFSSMISSAMMNAEIARLEYKVEILTTEKNNLEKELSWLWNENNVAGLFGYLGSEKIEIYPDDNEGIAEVFVYDENDNLIMVNDYNYKDYMMNLGHDLRCRAKAE